MNKIMDDLDIKGCRKEVIIIPLNNNQSDIEKNMQLQMLIYEQSQN